MKKIVSPSSVLIERTALEFAAVFYEIGRSQGLKSKYKTPRHYAAANLEKFVPHVIKSFLDMLNNPLVSQSQKDDIWEAIKERLNDPTAMSLANASVGHSLPDIDIAKLIPVQQLPSVIKDQRSISDFGTPVFRLKR